MPEDRASLSSDDPLREQATAPAAADQPSQTRTKLPASASKDDELPPDLLGRLRISIPGYRLLSVIGRGGQAIVFKAIQESTGKTVAVKLLKGGPITSPSTRERFDREVRALAAIDHPNIVGILDTGQTRHGHGFLVMNYIAGQSLKQLMEDAKLAPEFGLEPAAMLRLFKKICDAVNAAHMKGVTHRDLSPSNVIVDEGGEPHIVDFGLARTAFDRFMNVDRREVTVTGQFLGKIAYASPEQAQGKSDQIDIRTDVYALGVILYQLLTEGRFPYEVVGNIADVLNNIVNVKPTPPSQVSTIAAALQDERESARLGDSKTVVNPVIEAIVLRALEKNPADRYRSAGELAIDIGNYLGGQPTMAKVAKADVSSKRWGRSMSYAAAFLLLASGIAGGAYWWLRPAQSPEPLAAITPSDVRANAPESDAAEEEDVRRDVQDGNDNKPLAERGETPPQAALQFPEDLAGKMGLLSRAESWTGTWTPVADGIQSDEGRNSKLKLTKAPAGGYRLTAAFTPVAPRGGDAWIQLYLYFQGNHFSFVVGNSAGGSCAFSKINGAGYNKPRNNPTHRPFHMVAGHRYQVELEVRKDSLMASIDGNEIIRYSTDYSEMGRTNSGDAGQGEIGMGTYDCKTTFHFAELTPLLADEELAVNSPKTLSKLSAPPEPGAEKKKSAVKEAGSKKAPPKSSKQDDDEAQASAKAERGAPNLLTNLNLKVATIKGKWESVAGGGVRSDEVGPVKLRLSPISRDEYNAYFRFKPVQFKLHGTTKIHFGLWFNGTRFGWAIGTRLKGGACGFGTINGTPYYNNRSTSDVNFEANQEYDVEIRVRKNELTAFVNGTLMNAYETDYSDLSKLYTDPGNDLEICTQDCAAVFYSAKIAPLSESSRKDRKPVATESEPKKGPSKKAETENSEAQQPQKHAIGNPIDLLIGNSNKNLGDDKEGIVPLDLGPAPSDGYDLVVTFTPGPLGNDCCAIIWLSYQGRQFAYVVGYVPGGTGCCGFMAVNNLGVNSRMNPTADFYHLAQGQQCRVVINVRKKMLQASIVGGKTVSLTDYSTLSPHRWCGGWPIAGGNIGIGTKNCQVTFHSVVLTPRGANDSLPAAPRNQSSPPPKRGRGRRSR